MDYSVFGDVLAFDATYKKIRYNTPLVIFSGVNHHNKSVIFGSAIVGDETEESYIWLLETFVEAMEGKRSVSVITDGDLSMRKAIKSVFPNAHHRLCVWHLIRNVNSNIKDPKFLPKLNNACLVILRLMSLSVGGRMLCVNLVWKITIGFWRCTRSVKCGLPLIFGESFLPNLGQLQGVKGCTQNLVSMSLFYQICMNFYNNFSGG